MSKTDAGIRDVIISKDYLWTIRKTYCSILIDNDVDSLIAYVIACIKENPLSLDFSGF